MRDHCQWLIHRHRLVQLRMRAKNELQHLALNQSLQRKRRLWTAECRVQLEALTLQTWTARRRQDLLQLLLILEGQIELLNQAVAGVAEAYPSVRLLYTAQKSIPAMMALS
jgi:transposase